MTPEERAIYIPELEQTVLGGILLNPDLAGQVQPDHFHDPVHKDLFLAICQRDRAGLLVSPVSMAEWANAHEGAADLGGSSYLVKMASVGCSRSMFSGYVDQLQEMKARRDILDVTSAAREAILQGEEEVGTIIGRIEAALMESAPATRSAPVSMMAATQRALEQSWNAYQNGSTDAVHSGIPSLDHIVGGFYPGDLILLGGRPGMGKTAAALSMALNVARSGQGVVICSLEMTPDAMALRAMSEATTRGRTSVPYADMRRPGLTSDQFDSVSDAAEAVSKLPIQFLPRQYADIGALLAGSKTAKRILGNNMRLLIIDYTQLLRAKANSRYEEITKISIALKNLAGQLDVPILALSQLSRQLENRDNKRPQLSDLRESGQLEQDADTVMFCYREEYYLDREEPSPEDIDSVADWRAAKAEASNRLEIIVGKQRQGRTGTAHVMCNPATNHIWER